MAKAIRKETMTLVMTALGFPLYLYQKRDCGFFCDRLTLKEDQSGFDSVRYVVTGAIGCTCKGFVEFHRCKHLDMLNGREGQWVGAGVSSEAATADIQPIFEALGQKVSLSHLPLPEIVRVLTMTLTIDSKEMAMLAATRKIGDRTYGLRLVNSEILP